MDDLITKIRSVYHRYVIFLVKDVDKARKLAKSAFLWIISYCSAFEYSKLKMLEMIRAEFPAEIASISDKEKEKALFVRRHLHPCEMEWVRVFIRDIDTIRKIDVRAYGDALNSNYPIKSVNADLDSNPESTETLKWTLSLEERKEIALTIMSKTSFEKAMEIADFFDLSLQPISNQCVLELSAMICQGKSAEAKTHMENLSKRGIKMPSMEKMVEAVIIDRFNTYHPSAVKVAEKFGSSEMLSQVSEISEILQSRNDKIHSPLLE